MNRLIQKKATIVITFSLMFLGIVILTGHLDNQGDFFSNKDYKEEAVRQSGSIVEHFSYFSNRQIYDRAFDGVSDLTEDLPKIYGGIVPHHLLPSDIIAKFYKELDSQEVDTVVIVGPNHFGVGYGDIIISRAKWKTPYGYIQPDEEVLEALEGSGITTTQELPFENEHSITSQVAFIKAVWPEARIVPIILKYDTDIEQVEKLSKILNKKLSSEALVIASVDFSHNQPAWVSDFHDELSRGVIESFDIERIKDLEIDSPASIYTLVNFLSLRRAKKAIYQTRTNSASLLNNFETTENTSYLVEYFTGGQPRGGKISSVLFIPDLMFDRDVEKLAGENGGFEYLFNPLFNLEGQFFRGTDLIVANLEGPITNKRIKNQKSISFAFDPKVGKVLSKYNFGLLGLANNHGYDQGRVGFNDTINFLKEDKIDYFGHPLKERYEDIRVLDLGGQRLAFIAFNLTDHKVDEENLKGIISQANSESDFTVVFVHWGQEYQRKPSVYQRDLAKLFIDNGADVVVGHHPHVVQTIEMYKNKPIFYSLGNFIFDQYFSQATQEGLMVGAVFTPSENKFYLIPYTIPQSRPTLMLYADRQKFLDKLADDSMVDEAMKSIIKLGMIRVEN